MKIRVFEAFAGIGCQREGFEMLQESFPDDVQFEFVGISEIDAHAVISYNAAHGETPNYGDISKIDWAQVPGFDLFTYSFPCQSISNAGQQHGFSEGSGTRSSLLWECRKAIVSKCPKYLLMENVKALVQKKFMPDFQKWIDELESYGYKSFLASSQRQRLRRSTKSRARVYVVYPSHRGRPRADLQLPCQNPTHQVRRGLHGDCGRNRRELFHQSRPRDKQGVKRHP